MKKISIILLCIIALSACKSKKASKKPEPVKTDKLSLTEVDDAQKERAYDLGKRILMACNTSRFKPYTASEATPSVIRHATQDRVTKTCLGFRLKYGDFKDIQLVEVLRNKKDKSNIFRYKALYEKKIANKELRVTINEKNQVSAINSLDWKDKFK